MKTLIMTKGLPASGKSTWAKKFVCEHAKYKRVNKDDLRAMIDGGKWSKDNETFIVAARNATITQALTLGYSVIVDDTNLEPKHEEVLRQLAKLHNAEFEIRDFTGVPLEECIKRDRERLFASVGEKVIRTMYNKYLKLVAPQPPAYDWQKKDCIIVDIDGTIALKHEGRGYYEWSKVRGDYPRVNVIDMIETYAERFDARIVYVSGRDAVCRHETQEWLLDHCDNNSPLFMRSEGDNRDDTIVKREIYEQHIAPHFNVVAIFDDRPKICRMWQELGFGDRIFNVGTGEEF